MNTVLAKKKLQPVSFNVARHNAWGTNAQSALLKKMNACIKSGKRLSYDDVRYIYLLHVVCQGDKKRRVDIYFDKNVVAWKYWNRKDRPHEWVIKERLLQWLRLNIGSMVLKNMLVAIPVIDIDENA